ncbi:MAG: hypothetical protein IT315_06775 [Anaerolineales bacterium]|nr:hypothetical protein [Anaerolineales bacterium]
MSLKRKGKYRQDVLIGRRKRRAILQTSITDAGITFSIIHKDKVIATRSTSKTQNEEAALMRLSKAVSGLWHVFVIPVPQGKEGAAKRYFKTNN